MKLNDTQTYLSLVLRSLDASVVPNLQSQDGLAAVAQIKSCLEQLLTRHQFPVEKLREMLADGIAIAQQMRALAQRHEIDTASIDMASIDDSAFGAIDSFDQYLARYEQLSACLAHLSQTLANARSTLPPDNGILAVQRAAAQWEAEAEAAILSPPTLVEKSAAPEALSKQALADFIQHVHADGKQARLTRFERIPGGFGKQTFLIAVEDAAGASRELVVRKDDPAPFLLHPSCLIEREYHLVKAVAATGYPAPRPLWLGKDVPGTDASFYVMERVRGKPPGVFLEGGTLPEHVALELAEYLAKLHGIGLDNFSDFIAKFDDPELLTGTDTVEACYRRRIASWKHYARTTELYPSPMFEYLLGWLEANVPRDASPPVLLHGDYNIHNVLAENDHITGILDWELAGFGAREADLGYIKPNITKSIAWEKFYDHYLACGGKPYNPANLDFYQAFWMMRARLAASRVARNLHVGAVTDIRLTYLELGLNPLFMKIALDSTPVAPL